MDIITKAKEYATERHKGQTRKDIEKTPYITHPIHVSNILAEAGVSDTDTLIAALLHDVVEDTVKSPADIPDLLTEITSLFGENVTKIVLECSDDKTLSKVDRKKLQIEHASSISNEAKLVKLADKYSNMHNLHTKPPYKWSKEAIRGYAVWGYAVVKKLSGINSVMDSKFDALFKELNVNNLTSEQIEKELELYYKHIDKSE
jgi:(p)ppGpp synthase/HD superfamily hydrolase